MPWSNLVLYSHLGMVVNPQGEQKQMRPLDSHICVLTMKHISVPYRGIVILPCSTYINVVYLTYI
jgi:hypothetical protein